MSSQHAQHEDRGRVLIIAGSDSGGGAGVQADIKAVTALGGHAATAITAITVQNTLGVHGVFPIPLEIVEAQARAVLDDIGTDAIKTGMLSDTATVELAARLIQREGAPSVIDPVMVAKDGSVLLEAYALDAFRQILIPHATLLTPNAPEAAALTGFMVETTDDLRRAGEALLKLGCNAVLMKGGHVQGLRVVDILMTPVSETVFESGRIDTRHTHGTGCTLASACAAGLAQGVGLDEAVRRARNYVREAILRAPGFGAGPRPLRPCLALPRSVGGGPMTPSCMTEEDRRARLIEILRASPTIMRALVYAQALDLPDWRLVSGAVYQRVWNALTGRDPDHGIKDYDLCYFDPDLSWEAEDAMIKRAASFFPNDLSALVEVRNQARVHLWFEEKFGEAYTPLRKTDDMLERFLSPAFCVGVRLAPSGEIDVAAPFGLEDCFAMRLRPNPRRRINGDGFAKVADGCLARWPEVTIDL